MIEEVGESHLVICGVFVLEGDDNKEETDIGNAEEVEAVWTYLFYEPEWHYVGRTLLGILRGL